MPSKAAHVRDRHDKQHAELGASKPPTTFSLAAITCSMLTSPLTR
jgi:hypothetical protein